MNLITFLQNTYEMEIFYLYLKQQFKWKMAFTWFSYLIPSLKCQATYRAQVKPSARGHLTFQANFIHLSYVLMHVIWAMTSQQYYNGTDNQAYLRTSFTKLTQTLQVYLINETKRCYRLYVLAVGNRLVSKSLYLK